MDLIKKKLRIAKKKEKRDKKGKKGRTKTAKSKKKSKNSRDKGSSSESDSESAKDLRTIQSKNQAEAADIAERKFRMAGCLQYKPKDPPEFPKKLMGAEYREMFAGNQLSVDDCKLLDEFLRRKAELRSSDHIVLAEKVSNDDEKVTTRLRILAKYDEGRFGALYIVQNESAVDQNVVSVSNGYLMMKTAVRNIFSIQVTSRLNREIRILKAIATGKDEQMKRTPNLLFEGRVLGVPFFVIPFMDPNLEKCREEMGGTVSAATAFFIAQDVLVALKHIHKKGYVHRDVKPTNIVLNPANRRQWYLIDFGESVRNNSSMAMSPPDGITLPYISREAHDLLQASGGNYLSLDIESWFYVLLDLIKPLSWKDNPSIESVSKAKKKFWDELETSLPSPDYVSQVLQIGKLVKSGKQEPPYNEFSKLLNDGFNAVKENDWKPDWIDRQLTAQLNKEKRARTPESRMEPLKDKACPPINPTVNNNNFMDERNRDLMKINDNQIAQVVPESTREIEKPKERDRSMYAEAKEKTERLMVPAHAPHRVTSQELTGAPVKERSVYCDVNAKPVAPSPGGRKYRARK